MSLNTSPVFLLTPKAQWSSTGTAANTNLDGTGTTVTIFTANATNGSRVDRVVLEPLGTNVATVVRIFLNNGSAPGTAANNSLVYEVAMPANALSQVANSLRVEVPLNLVMPAGYRLLTTIGTAISAGIQITSLGGDF
jgi:hypothetical protein